MSKVQIADVIVPTDFQAYVIERTAQLSAFWRSGVVMASPELNKLAEGAGVTVPMPFWQDLTGTPQILSDSGALTPKKIGASQDIAAIHNLGDAWGANDLAGALAGSDPMAAIGDLVADYWARSLQDRLIYTVKGLFAAASMADSFLDLSTAGTPDETNWLTGLTFIDAKGQLGDSAGKLGAIAMHSAVEQSLRKQSLIDDVPGPDGRTVISVFQGLEVIVDDSLPTGTNVNTYYDTYIFGKGAVGYGEASDPRPIQGGFGDWYVEMSRAALDSDSYLINRKRCILHPKGIKWTSSSQAATTGATLAELATAANWVRVFERKNIRMVCVRHNIGNA